MFFADQLLSQIPTNAQVVHGLHSSERGAHAVKKVTAKAF